MTHDEMLAAAIDEAREDARHGEDDSVWEKLLHGTLDPAEEASLRARAQHDPEIALALEAYAPLRAGLRDDLVAKLTHEAPGRSVSPAVAHETPGPASAKPARRNGARVVSLVSVVAAPLAAAAGLALWIASGPSVADLPDYSLAFETSAQTTRSAAPRGAARAEVDLEPGTTVDLLIRPIDDAGGKVAVRAILARGADVRPWAPPVTVSEAGVVRITGKAAELFPETRGTWDLVVAVGRAPVLPTYASLEGVVANPQGKAPVGVRYVRGKVRFVDAR